MRFKPVFRYDNGARLLRLCRFLWTRGTVGDGKGYSQKVSLALTPRFFGVYRHSGNHGGFVLTLFGLRLNIERSYGGVHC
jgi:hypothetical protein